MSSNVFVDIGGRGKMIIVRDGKAQIFFTKIYAKHPLRNTTMRELETIQKAVEICGKRVLIHCDNYSAVNRARKMGIKVKLISGKNNPADSFKNKPFTYDWRNDEKVDEMKYLGVSEKGDNSKSESVELGISTDKEQANFSPENTAEHCPHRHNYWSGVCDECDCKRIILVNK